MLDGQQVLRPPSLNAALRGHDNALGFIRLMLAVAVIVDHSYPLGGFGGDPGLSHTLRQASVGSIAVAGFFAISGYLIAKSGLSSDVMQFMWRRFLRIFPAFWAVLLLSAFVIGPIIWVLDGGALGEYFRLAPHGPLQYLSANWTLSVGTWGIHDVFGATTPYGQALGGASVINGSIWTLSYEWTCYLIIGLLVGFAVLSKAKILVPLMTAFFLFAEIMQVSLPGAMANVLPYFANGYNISLTLTFLLGATIAVYSKSIPFDDRLGALAGLIVVLTLRFGGFSVLGTVAGVYFILYLGARLPAIFRRVGRTNDYSYGVYIFGFVAQQLLAHFGLHRLGFVPFVFGSIALASGYAWLSWHFVEKRAMAIKDWGPGKGIAHWRAVLRERFGRPETRVASIDRRTRPEPVEAGRTSGV